MQEAGFSRSIERYHWWWSSFMSDKIERSLLSFNDDHSLGGATYENAKPSDEINPRRLPTTTESNATERMSSLRIGDSNHGVGTQRNTWWPAAQHVWTPHPTAIDELRRFADDNVVVDQPLLPPPSSSWETDNLTSKTISARQFPVGDNAAGADIPNRSKNVERRSSTLLIDACKDGNIQLVRNLLTSSSYDVDERDSFGFTVGGRRTALYFQVYVAYHAHTHIVCSHNLFCSFAGIDNRRQTRPSRSRRVACRRRR
jgi:hypothetical protein